MDFGNTLVDYPLANWDSQIAFTQRFFENYIYLTNFPLKTKHSASDLAVRLNTENQDHSIWRFRERVRSSSFFGHSLNREGARRLEIAICQAVFDRAARFDDSINCIERLKRLGLRTGIVSNLPWGTSSEIWKSEFIRHGFGPDLIDQVVCCVDVGYRKPHPAALRECTAKLKCHPTEVIFVGDGIISDVQTAIAAGCLPVLLDRRNEFSSYAGTRVKTMDELLSMIEAGSFVEAKPRIATNKREPRGRNVSLLARHQANQR